MCATCGCSGHAGNDHPHPRHAHAHPGRRGRTLALEEAILAKNDRLAARNRAWLAERGILALNLLGAPGAGKTTLLERTLRDLRGLIPVTVIEGDPETDIDAGRLRATGCPVVQINTGAGCHLDAEMMAGGLEKLRPPANTLVFVENVGNLICPALFDLGEHAKVAVLSATEGEDKPRKYPHLFRASAAMVISKLDLVPHLAFDIARCIAHAHAVNPRLPVFAVSAMTGEGLAAWYDWLRQEAGAPAVPAATARSRRPPGSPP